MTCLHMFKFLLKGTISMLPVKLGKPQRFILKMQNLFVSGKKNYLWSLLHHNKLIFLKLVIKLKVEKKNNTMRNVVIGNGFFKHEEEFSYNEPKTITPNEEVGKHK